ncbi:hypothetical protein [Thiolinea disciformis]|uniref:hypothetical protein n=1 Tax=Thiolinea disciformis TaxID=125614 RepID=UPI000373B031|nr:hypothetical protein [Thiolinea disciformis]
MRKYFYPLLMATVILFGVILVITPYVAEYFFPLSQAAYQKPNDTEVKRALSDWFGAKPEQISEAQAMRRRLPDGSMDWYQFSLPPEAVKRFIIESRLQQQDLTPELMRQHFLDNAPQIAWWQPQALQQQTYFLGAGGGREVALIYNAEHQHGVMRVYTRQANTEAKRF